MDNKIKQTKIEVLLDKWKQLIIEYSQSGLSVKLWCKQNNIAQSTFYKYQREIRLSMLTAKPLPVKQDRIESSFIPLVIDNEEKDNDNIIISKGSIKIETAGNANSDEVINMIKLLLC